MAGSFGSLFQIPDVQALGGIFYPALISAVLAVFAVWPRIDWSIRTRTRQAEGGA